MKSRKPFWREELFNNCIRSTFLTLTFLQASTHMHKLEVLNLSRRNGNSTTEVKLLTCARQTTIKFGNIFTHYIKIPTSVKYIGTTFGFVEIIKPSKKNCSECGNRFFLTIYMQKNLMVLKIFISNSKSTFYVIIYSF